MTAVIGMLNKNGVAIAADSAVTRKRGNNEKVTKNGNKMVRVSNVLPVSVMITGNAEFIKNPWDIIVRKYRHERGCIVFPTVEDVVNDLLYYLVSTDSLWESEWEYHRLRQQMDSFMNSFYNNMDYDARMTDSEGNLKRPRLFVKEALKCLKAAQKIFKSDNIGFREYDIEKFKKFLDPYLDGTHKDSPIWWISQFKQGIMDHIDELGEELWKSLYAYFTHLKGDWSATLIFTGYGNEETYPSLIAIDINEGFDRHINWGIVKKVNIDDQTPSAICPFAQTDVIKALLTGASVQWLATMDDKFESLYDSERLLLSRDMEDPDQNAEAGQPSGSPDSKDIPDLTNISHSNLTVRRRNRINKMLNENRHSWVTAMEDYDIRSMAELAKTLIELTGLHRILTFQQEGVGGDVDLAVITKTDGFTWLSRKSWYNHKDVGGRYGSLGI